MKKTILLIVSIALLLSGCTGGPAPVIDIPDTPPAANTEPPIAPGEPGSPMPDAGQEEPLLFTDSAGREVPLPQPLLHVAPGNAEAQTILFSLAPDRTALFTTAFAAGATHIGEAYRTLTTAAPDAYEAIRASGAQAILYMGGAMEKAELDILQEAAGLPVVFIDSGMDTLADAYRTLGGLFGMEEEAEECVEYIAPAIEDITARAAAIADAARPSVYIATGAEGLSAGDSDILTLAGAANAAEAGQTLTAAQLKALSPAVIIVANTGVYEFIGKDAAWQELEVVLMGLYYAPAEDPYNWVLDESTPGKLFAAKWLYTLLHPENGYNLLEETKLHYDFCYHVQLSDEQAEALLSQSVYKPIG